MKQREGEFNHNTQEWVEFNLETKNILLPPPPYYYPLNLMNKKEKQNVIKSSCEFMKITTFLQPILVNSAINNPNFSNVSQIYVNYRLLNNLSNSQLATIIIYLCNNLFNQYSGNLISIQNCQLYFTMLYQDMINTNQCEAIVTDPNKNTNSNKLPFMINYQTILCSEPIWCSHTTEFQTRLSYWQNPIVRSTELYTSTERDNKGCNGGKYLLYEPNIFHEKGIAGMLFEIGVLLRFAICHGRILYLTPLYLMSNEYQHSKWIHYLCKLSLFECFFESITNCQLTNEEIYNAPILKDDRQLLTYPFREEKVVKILQLPTKSHCAKCNDIWTGNVEIFDQLHIGILGFVAVSVNQSITNTAIFDILDPTKKELSGFAIFMDNNSMFWMSQMIRYIFQPKLWFSFYIQQYIQNHLKSTQLNNFDSTIQLKNEMYASFYITSTSILSIEKYFEILSYYSPHIQHIFISIDSLLFINLSTIISVLQQTFPSYTYYYLSSSHLLKNDNSFENFIYSIATLELSSKGATCIGNLYNTWDHLINILQRTRGDDGSDYYSINSTTSSYSICLDELR